MTRHTIDVHVGQKIREFRGLAGVTQTQLGKSLGVSFQQVQKYEIGSNRVAASRLYEVAKFLDVPVSAFFPDDANNADSLSLREDETALIRAYREASLNVQNAVRALTKSIEGD